MSVQYKTSDGWKNISSSSNNAVDTVADGNMNPVTSNAVYDKLYGNAGTYYSKAVDRPSGGWTINSTTGHMEISAADLTISNVPAGVYLAWIEVSGDANTPSGPYYCYSNSIARYSSGFQETGWGETIWPSCIYKHAGGNAIPNNITEFGNFNPLQVRMVLQRLY